MTDSIAELPHRATRAQVARLEAAIATQPQVELPLIHGFGPGFYARSMLIPAGTVLTGKAHATEHIFMLTAGTIAMTTDQGVVLVSAPYQAICPPGFKRVGYAHTDCVCVNIHITQQQDLAALETELISAPALMAPAQGA